MHINPPNTSTKALVERYRVSLVKAILADVESTTSGLPYLGEIVARELHLLVLDALVAHGLRA
jgi:hypothetical protein